MTDSVTKTIKKKLVNGYKGLIKDPGEFHFWKILKGVSRSFYLSLYFLPGKTRKIVALAYALARAADTLADTHLVAPLERIHYLSLFRKALEFRFQEGQGHSPFDQEIISHVIQVGFNLPRTSQLRAEHRLLLHLKDYLSEFSALPPSDKQRVFSVLDVIIQGMEFDLSRFPGGSATNLQWLNTQGELDQYCYFVAGVVGEFWTYIHRDHLPGMENFSKMEEARRFGAALQMTNILRDIPSDLERGRCYLPAEKLQKYDLVPRDLLHLSRKNSLQPLLEDLLHLTLEHYRAGIQYFLDLPLNQYRLRFATMMPLLIGIPTLGLLYRCPNLITTRPLKIKRKQVYLLMARGVCALPSNQNCQRLFRSLLSRVLP